MQVIDLEIPVSSSNETNTSLRFYLFVDSTQTHIDDLIYRTHMKTFKYNDRYPDRQLVSKEFRRCMITTWICCCYDFFVSYLYNNRELASLKAEANQVWLDPNTIPTYGEGAFLLMALLCWGDAHFYVVHRTLHEVPFLYKHVHKVPWFESTRCSYSSLCSLTLTLTLTLVGSP